MRRFDKRNILNGFTALFVICGSILFYFILFYWENFKGVLSKTVSIFTPVLIGVAIAYLLNPILKFSEKHIVMRIWNQFRNPSKKYKKEKAIIRGISVTITMIVFFLICYGLVMLIVPQVIESLESIIKQIPDYVNSSTVYFNQKADKLLKENPGLEKMLNQYWNNFTNWSIDTLIPSIKDLLSKTSSSLVDSVFGVIKTVINLIIGIIVSVYLLYSKESFCAQFKKIAYALLREERANNLINNVRYSNKIFGGFLSGKILDSIIIGILCYILMLILKLPYPVLISIIIGITNVIPCFGPFIGAIPSALFILIVSPSKCLTFLILIFILQQFDGNILGPKILGDSTGLSSFWVIFGITVCSSLLGLLGMFLGVPIFAVIYAAVKTFIEKRLEKKNLPSDTTYYIHSDFEPNDDADNKGKEFKFVRKTFENIVPERIKEIVGSEENKSSKEEIAHLFDFTKDDKTESDELDDDINRNE